MYSLYSYTYNYTQAQLFLIGRVSLFEEMDEWEFSNKILKLKEIMKKEEDEEENIEDTDFGKYFTETKLIGQVISYYNKIRCCTILLLYKILFINNLPFYIRGRARRRNPIAE